MALGSLMLMPLALVHAESREALGPGDSVRVTVFQNPDLTTEARISERGAIVFPLIGEVALAGRSPVEAGQLIAGELRRGRFLKQPQVNVSVLEVRSRLVSVLGQVARPGHYPLDGSRSKLTDLIAAAGGITATGNETVTVIGKREGKELRQEVDLVAIHRAGKAAPDVELRGGDTILVPRAQLVYVYGEVQRAGAYRLEPDMLVMQAISLGGGLTVRGTERGMTIRRRMPDGSVSKIGARPTDPLQADDVIYVPESLF